MVEQYGWVKCFFLVVLWDLYFCVVLVGEYVLVVIYYLVELNGLKKCIFDDVFEYIIIGFWKCFVYDVEGWIQCVGYLLCLLECFQDVLCCWDIWFENSDCWGDFCEKLL